MVEDGVHEQLMKDPDGTYYSMVMQENLVDSYKKDRRESSDDESLA